MLVYYVPLGIGFVLRVPNKTSLRQLRVDLGHADRSAPHRGFRSHRGYP